MGSADGGCDANKKGAPLTIGRPPVNRNLSTRKTAHVAPQKLMEAWQRRNTADGRLVGQFGISWLTRGGSPRRSRTDRMLDTCGRDGPQGRSSAVVASELPHARAEPDRVPRGTPASHDPRARSEQRGRSEPVARGQRFESETAAAAAAASGSGLEPLPATSILYLAPRSSASFLAPRGQ